MQYKYIYIWYIFFKIRQIEKFLKFATKSKIFFLSKSPPFSLSSKDFFPISPQFTLPPPFPKYQIYRFVPRSLKKKLNFKFYSCPPTKKEFVIPNDYFRLTLFQFHLCHLTFSNPPFRLKKCSSTFSSPSKQI